MNKIQYLFLVLLLYSCSPYNNNFFSNSYHNLTAHYNAYFIADERMNEIESSIFERQEWNYNKILPIYPQFDSVKSNSLKKEIEDCIQKASLAIQRHPGSKWEDKSYILVAKARYYALEFPDAIEICKYVNTHSKNDNNRHQALVELVRFYTESNELKNALATIDYLGREELNQVNQAQLYMNTAYFYQKKGDKNKMVLNLVKGEGLLPYSSDKARINFIIAQTYQELNFKAEAFKYYKNVLKKNPKYELEFYTKLYLAQVTGIADNSELKKTYKYFKKLLKDSKNKEYRDKIYYEMAGFDLKNGNLENAIKNYKLSVKSSQNNEIQKAYSYLSLGKIYYDSLKNFVLAKSYYDSTVMTLPKTEKIYKEIQKKQEILVEFVKNFLVVQQNDSLLHLVSLPKDSLLSLITSKIENQRIKEKEKKKREKTAAVNRSKNISKKTGENIIATTSVNSIWYFSNSNAISIGRNDFLSKWGNRPLEDNWRRKGKKSINLQEETITLSNTRGEKEETEKKETETAQDEAKKLITSLPYTPEKQNVLLNQIEEALYNLGNIYNFQLKEEINAVQSFEQVLSRFPESEYEPEILYQLYLLYKNIDTVKSTENSKLLIKKYSETVYAKLIDNPNYREENFAATEKLMGLYKKLYVKYKDSHYDEVLFAIDSALLKHPTNEFSDNLAFLRVLSIGQTEEDYKYQFELGQFIKKYPESDLHTYAKSLLITSEKFQQERYNSGKARFIKYFNQKHTFVLVYNIDSDIIEELTPVIDKYLKQQNLNGFKTANLILSDKKTMLLINSFPEKATAINFLNTFKENLKLEDIFKGQKFDQFVITNDNFNIFYQTKDLSTYLEFFKKNYK